VETFAQKYQRWAFAGLVLAVAIGSIYIMLPFLPAVLWATVLSVLMYPSYNRFRKRFSPNVSSAFTTVLTIGIVALPLMVIGTILFVQINSFVRELAAAAPAGEGLNAQTILHQIDAAVHPFFVRLGAEDMSLQRLFEDNREALTATAGGMAGVVARSTAFGLFTLIVAFLTMFFMLRDGYRLRGPALDLIPLPRENSQLILDRMEKTIFAVFVGVVLVATVQGTIAGIFYALTGVPQPVMWAVATAVLCVIPLLGAPVVYVPLALLLFAQGHYVQAAILLGGGFFIVSQIDNILRPFVIGARVELHAMAVFFSLLGGVLLLGPLGIMAGPVFLTLGLALQDIVRQRILLSEAPPEPELSPLEL
jgi:predicted PurR-regulated permease PerM